MKRKALLLLPLSTLALVGCSKISIVDSSDNALLSYTLKQSCNQIIFSHSGLALNSSYRIVNGSTHKWQALPCLAHSLHLVHPLVEVQVAVAGIKSL